jgi:hypothetical protein
VIEQTITAGAGYAIVAVERRSSQNSNVDKTQWQIGPDGKSVKVTGQIKKATGPITAVLNERLMLTEQKRVKASREPVVLAGAVTTPGSTTLRLPTIPANWADVTRQYRFELRQNDSILWQGTQLPHEIPITLNGQAYTLAGGVTNGRVQIQLAARVAAK